VIVPVTLGLKWTLISLVTVVVGSLTFAIFLIFVVTPLAGFALFLAARTLAIRSIERVGKVLALLLFVIGFAFDLLAT